jgi:hypothetical protein
MKETMKNEMVVG